MGKKYEVCPYLVVLLKYHAKYRFDAGYSGAAIQGCALIGYCKFGIATANIQLHERATNSQRKTKR